MNVEYVVKFCFSQQKYLWILSKIVRVQEWWVCAEEIGTSPPHFHWCRIKEIYLLRKWENLENRDQGLIRKELPPLLCPLVIIKYKCILFVPCWFYSKQITVFLFINSIQLWETCSWQFGSMVTDPTAIFNSSWLKANIILWQKHSKCSILSRLISFNKDLVYHNLAGTVNREHSFVQKLLRQNLPKVRLRIDGCMLINFAPISAPNSSFAALYLS